MKELFQRNTKLQNIKVCQDGDELVIFHTDNKYSKVGKTIAYRLPAKYIYCLQCYEMPFYILKEVKRILQLEKDSNIPPTVNTDNKEVSMMGHEPVGVVESAGEALFSLINADFRTIQKALLSYYHWTDNHDFCFGDDEEKKQQSLENIDRLRNLFINAEGLGA